MIDGTYELFRQFYGLRGIPETKRRRWDAAVGVLQSILEMIEQGATHLGVATDHVIESYRNDLWPGYKTGAGIDSALFAQFHPLEEGSPTGKRPMGVAGAATDPVMPRISAIQPLCPPHHSNARPRRLDELA